MGASKSGLSGKSPQDPVVIDEENEQESEDVQRALFLSLMDADSKSMPPVRSTPSNKRTFPWSSHQRKSATHRYSDNDDDDDDDDDGDRKMPAQPTKTRPISPLGSRECLSDLSLQAIQECYQNCQPFTKLQEFCQVMWDNSLTEKHKLCWISQALQVRGDDCGDSVHGEWSKEPAEAYTTSKGPEQVRLEQVAANHLPWGIVQQNTGGGPDGVLAAIQAEMLRYLLWGQLSLESTEELQQENLEPATVREALARSLGIILARAALMPSAFKNQKDFTRLPRSDTAEVRLILPSDRSTESLTRGDFEYQCKKGSNSQRRFSQYTLSADRFLDTSITPPVQHFKTGNGDFAAAGKTNASNNISRNEAQERLAQLIVAFILHEPLQESALVAASAAAADTSDPMVARAPIHHFQEPGGLMLLLLSLFATRNHLREEFDDPDGTTLTVGYGNCSQELMNLVLTGQAVTNVFDFNQQLGDDLTFCGVSARSSIGYLTQQESLGHCEVGHFYKSPYFPIWVVGLTSQFVLLWGSRPALQGVHTVDENDQNGKSKKAVSLPTSKFTVTSDHSTEPDTSFTLYCYSGAQDGVLTHFEVKRQSSNVAVAPDDPLKTNQKGKKGGPSLWSDLEGVVRTKWPSCKIKCCAAVNGLHSPNGRVTKKRKISTKLSPEDKSKSRLKQKSPHKKASPETILKGKSRKKSSSKKAARKHKKPVKTSRRETIQNGVSSNNMPLDDELISLAPSQRANDEDFEQISHAREFNGQQIDRTGADADNTAAVAAAGAATEGGESDDNDSVDLAAIEKALTQLYHVDEFTIMWEHAEIEFGHTTEDIEDGKLVRQANSKINNEDSFGQETAQYGRLLITAAEMVLRDFLEVQKSDIFVDLGHGIGNVALQASYMFGCESRGIEVVNERNLLARIFQSNLEEQRHVQKDRDGRVAPVGKVEFKHGRLEDPDHREWLTLYNRDGEDGHMKVFVNNFNCLFADRSAKIGQKYYLDHFVAGLFSLMKPGSKLLTLYPLALPPPYSEASKSRNKRGLTVNADCSFFEHKVVKIGKAKDCVSWSQNGSCNNIIEGHLYTRLQQEADRAVILCCNPACEKAQKDIPINVTNFVSVERGPEGEVELCPVICEHCDCGVRSKTFRNNRKRAGNFVYDYY